MRLSSFAAATRKKVLHLHPYSLHNGLCAAAGKAMEQDGPVFTNGNRETGLLVLVSRAESHPFPGTYLTNTLEAFQYIPSAVFH